MKPRPMSLVMVEGVTGPSGPGTTAREVTCVKNSQGQTFCYEVLNNTYAKRLLYYVLMHSNALHTFTIYTGKITQLKPDKI
jgi:hypothetical protein